MENLEVKKVPFMGTELMAARDNDGQIWAGVRWMCDGIGLTKGQMQNERNRIHEDKVLSKGERNLVLPTKGGNQSTLCLKLDYVPLWLAKIAITPKMEQETPELAERLEQYQLKAKNVLADAFLPGRKVVMLPKDYPSALRALADEVEKNNALTEQVSVQRQQIAEMKPKVTYYDVVLNCTDLVPTSVIAKDYGWSATRMNRYLHSIGVQYKQGNVWLLYQNHAQMGYTSTKTILNEDRDGNMHAFPHTYWTQKGRLFVYEQLKNNEVYPLIERRGKG